MKIKRKSEEGKKGGKAGVYSRQAHNLITGGVKIEPWGTFTRRILGEAVAEKGDIIDKDWERINLWYAL